MMIYNDHKSSVVRCGSGQTEIPGEHLYEHYCGEGYKGLDHVTVRIIGKTDARRPLEREGFCA